MDPLLITTIGGVLGTLGFGGIVVALINKRADPFAQAQQIIDVLQEERTAEVAARARTDTKLDGVYESLGAWRTYGDKWDDWYANGMPDPPGRPTRPILLDSK